MGHLTFDDFRFSRKSRLDMFTATLRAVCHANDLYYPKLFWALRQEIGTRRDVCPHFHFLIAALPEYIDLNGFCRQCRAVWRVRGGGIAKIVTYDRELGGAGYVGKCSDYEIGPAGDDCELMFSDAATAYLRRVVKRERGP